MNGVVLQSTILNFGLDNGDGRGGDDWGYILYLPTESATAWYHHKTLPNAPASLGALLPDVERFALGEYADALSKGAIRSRRRVRRRRLQSCTVISAYRNNTSATRTCAFPTIAWKANCCAVKAWPWGGSTRDSKPRRSTASKISPTGIRPTRRSTRHSRPKSTPTCAERCATIRRCCTDKGAYDQIQDSGGWDLKHRGISQPDVTPDLAEAMSFNPDLRIFSANGYYDFATPYFETTYALGHLGILPSLQKNITYGFYQSGHMIYLQPDALTQMHDDLERWYAATLAGR